VVQVPAIPRTLTGKKLEVPIKRLFMGADPATALNRNAVSDPGALDAFVELAAEVRRRTGAPSAAPLP
jgi:acetoacetyl-CoA synthetase